MKLVKQKYYNANGEEKINCYTIKIPKAIVVESDIEEEDELVVKVVDGKIVVERVKK